MPRRPLRASFQAFSLDPSSPEPLHRQLYDELRSAILNGRILAGSRLPASRELATAARVSRNTVLTAYEQLSAEGYIHSRSGSGTYVAESIPESLPPESATPAAPPATGDRRRIAERGERARQDVFVRHEIPQLAAAFRPGLPALDHLPMDTIRRIADRRLRRVSVRLLAYGDPMGYLPLRAAIAAQLAAARGVRTRPENVLIVNGAQEGVTMCARLLADPGESVWMEEPGYFGARSAFSITGARLVPVPVDADGLDVAAGIARAPRARVAYCTPSHQNPTGVTLSLARRMALLQWAQTHGAWIVEDDNASEYRYRGRPLAALQGIDRAARVLYVGTFSKVLFSSLRLGYVVLPDDLVPAFSNAQLAQGRGANTLVQAVVADLIEDGHLGRHVRRMRTLYAARLEALERAVARHGTDVLRLQRIEGGLNQLAWLPDGVDDLDVASDLAGQGIVVMPLRTYYATTPARPGLVLGFAAAPEAEIDRGIERIAATVREHQRRARRTP